MFYPSSGGNVRPNQTGWSPLKSREGRPIVAHRFQRWVLLRQWLSPREHQQPIPLPAAQRQRVGLDRLADELPCGSLRPNRMACICQGA